MALDLDKMTKWMDSPEGQASLTAFANKLKAKYAVEDVRSAKIHALSDEDFDKLMNRMIISHGEEYCQACYDKGYVPHPTPLLYLLFHVAEKYGKDISDEYSQMFTTTVHEYRNYQFELCFGQGTVCYVAHNKEYVISLS